MPQETMPLVGLWQSVAARVRLLHPWNRAIVLVVLIGVITFGLSAARALFAPPASAAFISACKSDVLRQQNYGANVYGSVRPNPNQKYGSIHDVEGVSSYIRQAFDRNGYLNNPSYRHIWLATLDAPDLYGGTEQRRFYVFCDGAYYRNGRTTAKLYYDLGDDYFMVEFLNHEVNKLRPTH